MNTNLLVVSLACGVFALSCGGKEASEGSEVNDGTPQSNEAPQDNAEIDYTQTKTLTMDTFPVPANSEVFYCQTFANPWGQQVDIKTYDLTMDTGSHHMFAFYQSNATDAPVAMCPAGGLTYGAFTFRRRRPRSSETFPDTVGATIPTSTGFNLMVHYLNTRSKPLTAHVSLTMYVAKSGVVTNHAGVIFDNNVTMTVPATAAVRQHVFDTLDQDVNILEISSHMHKFGKSFTATYTPPGGHAQTLYRPRNGTSRRPTCSRRPSTSRPVRPSRGLARTSTRPRRRSPSASMRRRTSCASRSTSFTRSRT